MLDGWQWLTHMEHSKPLALILFFGAFCGILIYVFFGQRRSARLESYKYIPFLDDPLPPATMDAASSITRTEKEHE